MRKTLPPIVLALWLLAAAIPAAAQSTDLPNCANPEQWDQLLEAAQEKGLAILVVRHNFGDVATTNAAAKAWAEHKATRGMLKLHVTGISDVPAVRQAAATVSDSYNYGPKLYIFDPQLRLIGYRNYRDREATDEALRVAGQVLRWQASAQREIAKADGLAADGRFERAFALIEAIAAQDIKTSHAVKQLWRDPESTHPEAPTRVGRYFPTLMMDKRSDYEKLAAERLSEATAHFEAQDYRKALAVLRPLAADRSDLPQVQQAKELSERIALAMREPPAQGPAASDD